MKCYFGVLDNLYVGQIVVLWFGEGQKFQFLSYPLPIICHVPETVLQIKHWTTGIVQSCPSFFNKPNAKVVQIDVSLLYIIFYFVLLSLKYSHVLNNFAVRINISNFILSHHKQKWHDWVIIKILTWSFSPC